MICAEMPLAAARTACSRPLRPAVIPPVPATGIIASTVLASVAMAVSYMGASGAAVFTTLVLMTGITAAVPYAFSALAQLRWRCRPPPRESPRLCFDLSVAVVRCSSRCLHLLLAQHRGHLVRRLGTVPDVRRRRALGIPVYLAQRKQMTEPPDPLP